MRISSLGVDASMRALRFMMWIALPVFILIMGLSSVEGTQAADQLVSVIYHPLFVYPALAVFGMFCMLPFVACLFKSVYGRELAIGGYFCDIKSGSSPDSASGVTMVTLPPKRSTGLRHGLYNHEDTPGAIARYVSNHLLSRQKARIDEATPGAVQTSP